MRKNRRLVLLCGLIGLVSFSGLALWNTIRTSLIAGRAIKAGDLVMTPLTVTESKAIGSTSAPAGRSFYVLRAVVEDLATSADFSFDPHLVLVHASGSTRAVRSARGQRALGGDGEASIPPGGRFTAAIAFEGPPALTSMEIRFNLYGGPGDLVSRILAAGASIELPVTTLK